MSTHLCLKVRHSGDVWLEPLYAFICIRFELVPDPEELPRNAEENQVLTQHENRWQSKCGASWEISPLSACHCVPLDRFSHVFAMTAAWWKHQPTPGQREREGKERENQRGEVAEESSPIRSRSHDLTARVLLACLEHNQHHIRSSD